MPYSRQIQTFCQRCDKRIPVSQARLDGYSKGLVVCRTCYERPHPNDTPVPIDGPEIRTHPLQIPPGYADFSENQAPISEINELIEDCNYNCG